MKIKRTIPILSLAVLIAALYFGSSFSSSSKSPDLEEVLAGPLSVWTTFEGKIAARHTESILSGFKGSGVITEIIPDGTIVKKGDLLVRFDSSNVEDDLVKLERDFILAQSEFESLKNAKLPLELQELELQVLDTETEYEAERQYLADNRELMKEDLVSPQEVEQQKLKVEQLGAKLKKLQSQLELTRSYLHPSQINRAQANLDASQRALDRSREQLAACTVKAPVDGMVVYSSLHVGGEYRVVRVGDSLYRRQAFMRIPTMDDPQVKCHVPESELSKVQIGQPVEVTPVAYPDLKLNAKVASVGPVAQIIPGRARWQKYFPVLLDLEDNDERVRDGMSVTTRIQSYYTPNATQVARSAVWWDHGEPHCTLRQGRSSSDRLLKLGWASETHFEVLEGLEPGDMVVRP